MHTEVCLRFHSEVSLERLCIGMPLSRPSARLLRESALLFEHQSRLPDARVGVETTFLYLVFRENTNAIRILVTPRTRLTATAHLIRKAQEIAQRFLDNASSARIGCRTVALDVHAEEALVAVGRRRSFAAHLVERFVDTAFGDVMIGFLTFLLTGVMTDEWTDAAIVGMASVLCFFAWLAIEAAQARGDYEFHHL